MSRRLQVAAACGIAAPIAFVVSTVVAGALRDGYDPATQAISELFEVGAPTSGLVAVGLFAFWLVGLAGADGGLVQRGFTFVSDLWFVTAGVWLLVRTRRTSRSTRSVR